MARRRLQAILATTVITTGLSAAPAMALPGLEDVTDPLEEVVEPVTDPIEEAVEPVEDVVEPVTETVSPVLERPAAEDDDPPPPPVEAGTGDGTLDVSADVDIAESDADGSPELELDATVTVLGTTVDVGDATDPVEDLVDPDPDPDPSTPPSDDPSSDDDPSSQGPLVQAPRVVGPGGLFAGGGLQPSGGDVREVQDPGGANAAAPAVTPAILRPGAGQGVSGGGSGGAGTTAPDVATTDDRMGADAAVEEPAVMAADGPGAADSTESSALLRLLAAAMVLATAGVWLHTTRQPGGGFRMS